MEQDGIRQRKNGIVCQISIPTRKKNCQNYINNYKDIKIFLEKAAEESENIARARIKIKGYTKTIKKKKLDLDTKNYIIENRIQKRKLILVQTTQTIQQQL